ncbi:NAD-dependent epimerase/dehydratase family protein [Desulfobacterota bacterium AH_259_B03_O07]|nr:NAD-dependent epimerase/dehydratase family protein [Desulfobacterota bacterium AH_259_B03_O07]
MSYKNVLLTGASGGIGRYLEYELIQKNYNVYSVTSSNKKVLGIKINCDLVDENIESKIKDFKIDIIIHACLTKRKNKDILIVDRLLNLCAKKNIKLFVFFSSWVIHSQNLFSDHYTKSKLISEDLIKNKCHETGLNYIILRPTLVVGRGLIWTDPISKLNFLPKYLPDRYKVNIIHVKDLVAAIIRLLSNENFYNDEYDLGGFEVSFRKYCVVVNKNDYSNYKRGIAGYFLMKWLNLTIIMLSKTFSTFSFFLNKYATFNDKRTYKIINYTPQLNLDYLDQELNISYPTNQNELIELISKFGFENVNIICMGYSFLIQLKNPADKKIISLQKYDDIIELTDNHVYVQSGITIKNLLNFLDNKNLTIDSLPEFLDVGIGSCVKTPVHGSSYRYSNVAELFDYIKIYKNGTIREISKGSEEYNNLLFNKNNNSVILEVGIKHTPVYFLKKEIKHDEDSILLKKQFINYFYDNESVTVNWYPSISKVMIWEINKIDKRFEDKHYYIRRHAGISSYYHSRIRKKQFINKNHKILGLWPKLNTIERNIIKMSVKPASDIELGVLVGDFYKFIPLLYQIKHLFLAAGFRISKQDYGIVNSPSYLGDIIWVEVIGTKKPKELIEIKEKFHIKCHNGKYEI